MPLSEVENIDCMVGMKRYPDKYFHLAVVDPPYGLPDDAVHGRGKLKNRIINSGNMKWDIAPDENFFTELFRVSKNQIIWGGNYFKLPPCRGFIIWDKQQPFENFSAAEFAWTSFGCPSKIYRQRAVDSEHKKIHPTQKSIPLYKFCIGTFAENGDKILDTHMGSGSSRIAAYDMGFDFTGFELDEEYFKAGNQRFELYRSQTKLF